MNHYTNSKYYGCTAARSVFKPYGPEPEPMYEEPPQQAQSVLNVVKPERRYLPGEKLLLKLNKQEEKKKPLDLKIIEKSISDILDRF